MTECAPGAFPGGQSERDTRAITVEAREYWLEPSPRQVPGAGAGDLIYLSVDIGHGQTGSAVVTHGGLELARGDLSRQTRIGSARELAAGEIEVAAHICAVNRLTARCVFTTTFYNQHGRVLYSRIDKGEGLRAGIARFLAAYRLTAPACV